MRLVNSSSIITTRYAIAKNVFNNISGKYLFDKIFNAIREWAAVVIEFKGVFHIGDKKYTTRILPYY